MFSEAYNVIAGGLFLIATITLPLFSNAQDKTSVKWHVETVRLRENEIKLKLTASIKEGWHMYSQFQEKPSGPALCFEFVTSNGYALSEERMQEYGTSRVLIDPVLGRPVRWLEGIVLYEQNLILKAQEAVVQGIIKYCVCNYEKCVPEQFEFRAVIRK